MNILVVLLLVAGTASVVASFPQHVRPIRLKHSDEFSVISWSVWLLYQVVSLIYAFRFRISSLFYFGSYFISA